MTNFMNIWLEKIAEKVPHHEHAEYAKKDHKHPNLATKEEAKEIAEDVVEDHEENMHKDAAMASDVKNAPKPVLVVTFSPNDEMSKQFIQRLDRVLSNSSGLERLQIKAFNSMKDSSAVGQLKAPKVGITLYRGGKMVDSLGNADEQSIRKFVERNKKNII